MEREPIALTAQWLFPRSPDAICVSLPDWKRKQSHSTVRVRPVGPQGPRRDGLPQGDRTGRAGVEPVIEPDGRRVEPVEPDGF